MVAKDAEPVLLQKRLAHGVVHLALNRPRAGNAFNKAMYEAVTVALKSLSADAATRIIVLSGTSTTFTAGMDIVEAARDSANARDTVAAAAAFMRALRGCRAVVVAAVAGAVTGIGVTLLAHVDLVWSARGATFATPFWAVGIVPEFGSSLLFRRLMGSALGARLLLRGERVGADELAAVGFLRILPPPADDVVAAACADACEWSAACDDEAWRAVERAKQLIIEPEAADVERAMVAEFRAIDEQIESGTVVRKMNAKVAEMRGRRQSRL